MDNSKAIRDISPNKITQNFQMGDSDPALMAARFSERDRQQIFEMT